MTVFGPRLVQVMAADGVVLGVARCLLAALCVAALLKSVRGGDALAGPIMALVFIMVYALVLDWHEAAIVVFAPERALWDLGPGLGWRVVFTACRLAAAGIFWSCLMVDLIPAGGLFAIVPVGASVLQHLCISAGLRRS